MTKQAVKRAAGFAPQFDFYAEVTVDTEKGMVTAREGAYTANGAVTRATMTATERTIFAGMKRAAGFVADALVADVKAAPKTAVGFA
jgi:hypothetical protein